MTSSTTATMPASLSPDDALVGDRYRLEAPIGEGSFCRVYRALDTRTGSRVAVKVLKQAGSAKELTARADRFLREARVCCNVRHPGVVRLLDCGLAASSEPFAIFELIEGRTLRQCLDEEGPFARATAIRLMTQVLEALAALHAEGILHRDLKPENIMVADERAVLLDFGFAGDPANDRGGLVVGTPQYAAPEILRGEPATVRSDLYSWGLTLLECLTGTAVVGHTAAHEAAGQQLESAAIVIPREAIAAGVSGILRRAVAKVADDRPESATAVLRDLERYVPGNAPLPSSPGNPECGREIVIVSCRLLAAPTQDETAMHLEAGACIEFFAGHGGVAISAVADRVTIVFGLRGEPLPPVPQIVSATMDWVEHNPESALRWSAGIHTGRRSGEASSQIELVGNFALEAQRLDQMAGAARVLVSTSVAAELPGWPLATWKSDDDSDATAARVLRRPGDHSRAATTTPHGTFIERPREMQCMADAWRAATSGQSSSLLVVGEAGIGKTRLLEEFRASLHGPDWIEARGVLEGRSRPFLLLTGLVTALGGSASNLAVRYGVDPAECIPILATLLGEPLPSGFAMPLVTPDRFKEITFQVTSRVLLAAAADQPTVVVLDDLHWADAASVEFVTFFLGECSRTRANLLLVLSTRPEFEPPWPATEVPRLELTGLHSTHVENLIREGFEEGSGLGNLVAQFARACQGNPLLAREAATLLRRGPELGNWGSKPPQKSDDLLAARIASLSSSSLVIVQTAAALGRDFLDGVLAAISNLAPGLLRETLDELIAADLVTRHQDAPSSHRFRHDLLRDAAYASIPDRSRPVLHLRIATTIRREFPEYATQRPAELALHFERGGDSATAAELWHQAGTKAMMHASYLDAREHFAHGLELLADEPPSPARAQRELALTTALATAHLSTEGFGAPATREGFSTARVMCTALGREAPLEIVGGIFGSALANADNEETAAIVPMFESLTTRTDQPMHCFAGHQVLGVHACWSGQHARSLEHTTAGMDLYRRSSVRDISWEFGFGLYCYGYGVFANYHRGHVDRAEAVRQEMVALAENSRHPYCIAVALGFSTTLTCDLRRPQLTMNLATRLLAVASEQHLYLWSAFAMCAQGLSLVQLGRAEDAITPIRMGIDLLDKLGFRCSHGYYLMYLVEALIALGEIDEALAVIDPTLAFYKERWTRFAEPNMVRLRGVALESRGDIEGAEREYRRALAIARQDGSRAYELRAATSLTSLLASTGDGKAARSELADVLRQFTEGLETADVLAARRALAGDASTSRR